MMSHGEMLESIALLALGTLPADEARYIVEHARDCAECRAEYADLRSAANALGYSAESGPAELDELSSARIKAAIMRGIGVGSSTVKANGAAKVAQPEIAFPSQTVTQYRTPWFAYVAAAAALVFALSSWNSMTSLQKTNHQLEQQVAVLQDGISTQQSEVGKGAVAQQRLAEFTAPDSKHFSVSNGEVVTSGGHVYLAIKVAALPANRVYQAWTLKAGAKTVAPSVTFVADNAGVTYVELPERATGVVAVAVSVEPAGGSKAPTTKPAFVRTLS